MDTKTDTPDEKSLYAQMKALSTKLEFLDITEGYVKDEMANLKREMVSNISFSYYENHINMKTIIKFNICTHLFGLSLIFSHP